MARCRSEHTVMAHPKGHGKRIIEAPGYHIRPKYDLKGLRQRRTDHGGKHLHADLPLTSMIDMFSILIIFLLLNFSSTGEIFFISKSIRIPEAKNSRQIESKALISIMNDHVTFDSQKVGDNPLHMTENDMQLPKLKQMLQQVRIMEQAIHPDKIFKGEVNIQADENQNLIYIKRVMNTLISEGWTGINFVVTTTGD